MFGLLHQSKYSLHFIIRKFYSKVASLSYTLLFSWTAVHLIPSTGHHFQRKVQQFYRIHKEQLTLLTTVKCEHYLYTLVKTIILRKNSPCHNPGVYEISVVLAGKYDGEKGNKTWHWLQPPLFGKQNVGTFSLTFQQYWKTWSPGQFSANRNLYVGSVLWRRMLFHSSHIISSLQSKKTVLPIQWIQEVFLFLRLQIRTHRTAFLFLSEVISARDEPSHQKNFRLERKQFFCFQLVSALCLSPNGISCHIQNLLTSWWLTDTLWLLKSTFSQQVCRNLFWFDLLSLLTELVPRTCSFGSPDSRSLATIWRKLSTNGFILWEWQAIRSWSNASMAIKTYLKIKEETECF